MKRLLVLLPVLLAIQVGASPALAWTWPVGGPVLQGFRMGADPYAGGQHRGIDVGAAPASPVVAPAGGMVSFAGTVPEGGLTVTIQTPNGYSITLVHLGAIAVERGALVNEGQPVGSVGPSGTPEFAEPYVHLGVRVTAEEHGYLDPLLFLLAPQQEAPSPEPGVAPADADPSGPASTAETPPGVASPEAPEPGSSASAAVPVPEAPEGTDVSSVPTSELEPISPPQGARLGTVPVVAPSADVGDPGARALGATEVGPSASTKAEAGSVVPARDATPAPRAEPARSSERRTSSRETGPGREPARRTPPGASRVEGPVGALAERRSRPIAVARGRAERGWPSGRDPGSSPLAASADTWSQVGKSGSRAPHEGEPDSASGYESRGFAPSPAIEPAPRKGRGAPGAWIAVAAASGIVGGLAGVLLTSRRRPRGRPIRRTGAGGPVEPRPASGHGELEAWGLMREELLTLDRELAEILRAGAESARGAAAETATVGRGRS